MREKYDMKSKIRIKNLDCAMCAKELEGELQKIAGVREAEVNFIHQSIRLDCETQSVYEEAIKTIGKFEKVEIVREDGSEERAGDKADGILVLLSAIFLVAGLIIEYGIKADWGKWVTYVCFGIAYGVVGWKVLWQTVCNIIKGKLFDENFLMTLASIGAIVLGQYAEAAEVMALYSIGEYLQSKAVGASRKSIAALMDLKSENARIRTAEGEKLILPEEVKIGDVCIIKAGEKVVADGVIVRGQTSFDTKSLSGESMLRDAKEGDEVLGGWINAGGVIEVCAQKEYAESAAAKVLELVENAARRKAKSEQFITKFARVYTPFVCLAALVIAFVVPLFTGNYAANVAAWINRALVFLVISCPCALVISVPLTYFSGIGYAAKNGILVKGSTGLDGLAGVKVAAFDKTGTLTYGNFRIGTVIGKDGKNILEYVAAAERGATHPIAEAFKDIETSVQAEQVCERAGKGIACVIDGKPVWCGNRSWFRELGIEVQEPAAAATFIHVACAGEYWGYITIEDTVKENAAETIGALKRQGIERCVMLTGDTKARAEKVAREVGADDVYAELLPGEKMEMARLLKERGRLLYVGDGINDAPVLMEADIGVSMGGVGSDAAIEASDVVLMRDDLSLLPVARQIARRTRTIVFENIVVSIAIKAVIMVLGLLDCIPLGVAVFADVGVMLLAVLNTFRARLPLSSKRRRAH